MCMIIGLTAPLFVELKAPLVRKLAAWIARYSYGIYLVHLYGLWVGIELMKQQPWWLRLAVILALSFGLPVLLYHSLESPLIRVGAFLTSRKRAPAPPIPVTTTQTEAAVSPEA
jgi:peptidoglycan/LPS O-acetylase OafA/YrhL